MRALATEELLMKYALRVARNARPEVPVAAILVDDRGSIAFAAANSQVRSFDQTGHAELNVIKTAISGLQTKYLSDYTLYVTLEPCLMCATAIRYVGLRRVVFGAYDLRLGAGGSMFDVLRDPRFGPVPEVSGGIMEEPASLLLTDFFGELRR